MLEYTGWAATDTLDEEEDAEEEEEDNESFRASFCCSSKWKEATDGCRDLIES